MASIPALLSSLIGAATGSGQAETSGNQAAPASEAHFKSLVAALTAKGNEKIGGQTALSTDASGAAQSALSQYVGANVQGTDPRTQLLDRIKSLLQNGVSMSQIVSTLASNLAQQVGAALGKTDDTSLSTLKTAFAAALSPPGNGPPDPAALAARLRSLSSTVARVLGTSTGQQNRFTGNTLDANEAGGNPAPNQTQTTTNGNTPSSAQALSPGSIFATALTALNGPIDPPQAAAGATAPQPTAGSNGTLSNASTTAAVNPAVPNTTAPNGSAATDAPASTPSPVSTDSLVAASSLDAAGTGGGTLLGRTLTRAANAAADLGANPLWPVVNGAPASSSLSSLANRVPENVQAGTASTGGSALTGAATAATNATASAPNQTVAAFLESFQRALAAEATNAGGSQTGTQDQSNDPDSNLMDASSNGNGQPFLASIGTLNDPQTSQGTTTQTSLPQQTTGTTDPSGIVDQLLRGIGMRDLGQSSEVRLRLVPESLGDLSVKLTVDHSGTVNASVVAQTPEARDALLANQNQLTRSLADAGLKLTGFSVSLSNSGANLFGQQQQQPQQQQPRFGSSNAPVLASGSGAGDDPLLAVPSFAPPALAAARAGSLNYLV